MTRAPSITDDVVSDAVERSVRTWRRAGVRAADRASLVEELTHELRAAEADGYGIECVLGPDIEAGAAEWACERDLTGRDPRYGVTVGSALAPIVVALLIAFALTTSHLGGGFVITGYAVSIAIAYFGAVFATSAVLRQGGDRSRDPSVRALIRVLPIAGAVAAPAGVGAAAMLNFSWSIPVIIVVLLVVVAVFTAAIAATRRFAVSGARDPISA